MKNILMASVVLSVTLYSQAFACEEGYIVGAKTGKCIKETDSCGTNCTYTIDSQGNLVVSGTGSIQDSAFKDNKDIINATIEYGITGIGGSAFGFTSNMQSISIANSVTGAGGWAFYKAGLKSLTLPDSMKKSNTDTRYMCGGCNNLETFSIPSNWGTSLGELLLGDTPNLKMFVVPESVTYESWQKPSSNAWNANTGATLYCTASQISKGICDADSIRYEKDENGNYVAYNPDGSINSVFSSFTDFQQNKVVDEYDMEDVDGNIFKYDGRGHLLYKKNTDGSAYSYDQSGKLIGIQGKRILTVDEATALVKGNKNTFSIRYR